VTERDPHDRGALILRGTEFDAARLMLLFGAGLLFGYIAAKRTTCFLSPAANAGPVL
jgi:hypothetical protein